VAKPKVRRLKVFEAQFGFYDTVVAAPSRAAAMRAWGVRQNVFADGQARLTDDEAAIAAATAHPETVLKRPVGSSAPFEVDPQALPTVPDAPRKKAAPKAAKPKPAPPKPPANRAELSKAEAALRDLDEGRKAEEAAFRKRQAALDAEAGAAQAAYFAHRKAATSAVVKTREAYRKAGGQD
jgi:hypothetical protein